MKIAVIGSGIAGLGAAWLLAQRHQVVLFEAQDRLGGHSNTRELPDGRAVDTGFIVYNDVTYPNLIRLFAALGVEPAISDMSFGVSLDNGRLEYSSDGLPGLFAQRRNMLNPRFHSMWRDILRFHKEAPLLAKSAPDDLSLAEFLTNHGYGIGFIEDHLLPMAAAIWSADLRAIRDFPVKSFVRFFLNHGLLTVRDRLQWHTVAGGSRRYVEKLAAAFAGEIRQNAPVEAVRRDGAGVSVHCKGAEPERFDHAVLACHSDEALALLDDADETEAALLGAIRYQPNRAILHTDTRLLPRRRRAWASWNYLADRDRPPERPVTVSYWMNRLQNIPGDPVVVTLNPSREPDPARVAYDTLYSHPIFDTPAIAAQQRLGEIQGQRNTWFCGAWCGFGFHEDGLSAGLAVAEALGGVHRPWQAQESSPSGQHALAGYRAALAA